MEADAAAIRPVMTPEPGNPWKMVAIVLAVALIAVLIYAALVVAGVMKLGLSLI